MSATAHAPAPGQSRLIWLLLALFMLPVAISLLLYFAGWRPGATANHGELLAASALSHAGLRDEQGRAIDADTLRGHWLLVLADAGPCAEVCQARLDETRRVHVALNKNMARVKRVWLAAATDPALTALRRRYPDLLAAQPFDAPWRELLPATGTRVFVIDPEGRPVLRYAEPLDARGLLKDMERLLKLSWLG